MLKQPGDLKKLLKLSVMIRKKRKKGDLRRNGQEGGPRNHNQGGPMQTSKVQCKKQQTTASVVRMSVKGLPRIKNNEQPTTRPGKNRMESKG